MYWNGTQWVDQYGAPAGTTPTPQGQVKGPKPRSSVVPNVFSAQPTQQQAPVAPNNGWRTQTWGYDIYDPNGQWDDRGWERSRSGIAKGLYDYLVGGGYDQAKRNDANRQMMYDQMIGGLDSGAEYNRIYNQTMGGGMDAASVAASQAMALGMDPAAAALGARNSNIVAAHRAASAANDPAVRANRMAQLINAAQDVSNPSYLPMLAIMMQYDAARNAENQTNIQMDASRGSGFGSAFGLLGSLASGGAFNDFF